MNVSEFDLRIANLADVESVAMIARISRQHFLPYLPILHSLEEDVQYFATIVFKDNEIWLAEKNGTPIGFCAFKECWLEHLYCLPGHVGMGVGALLLNKAKAAHGQLSLWVFQQNVDAVRFYERHGFHKVLDTDGSDNEEKVPDALYRWKAVSSEH